MKKIYFFLLSLAIIACGTKGNEKTEEKTVVSSEQSDETIDVDLTFFTANFSRYIIPSSLSLIANEGDEEHVLFSKEVVLGGEYNIITTFKAKGDTLSITDEAKQHFRFKITSCKQKKTVSDVSGEDDLLTYVLTLKPTEGNEEDYKCEMNIATCGDKCNVQLLHFGQDKDKQLKD